MRDPPLVDRHAARRGSAARVVLPGPVRAEQRDAPRRARPRTRRRGRASRAAARCERRASSARSPAPSRLAAPSQRSRRPTSTANDTRDHHEAEDDGLLGVRLERQVDRQRHRLGRAGEVAGERDRGAELAERPRPGEHGAGGERRPDRRQRDPAERVPARGAERAGGVLVAAGRAGAAPPRR